MPQQQHQIVPRRIAPDLLRADDLPPPIEPVRKQRRLFRLGPRHSLLPIPNPRPRADPLVDPNDRSKSHATLFFTFSVGSPSSTNFSFPALTAHSSEMTIISSLATPHSRDARFTPSPMAV